MHFKDENLNRLSGVANVAQFVSFAPDLKQRYSNIYGHEPNRQFASVEDAITALFRSSGERKINVRTYDPDSPKSCPFPRNLTTVGDVIAALRKHGDDGLYLIANEAIDIYDGGVSGVMLGDMIEFSPGDTPRCVEKAGTCQLPVFMGRALLQTMYGFLPNLFYPYNKRVEFSLHPQPRGIRHENTIIWEIEEYDNESANVKPKLIWPNNYSRLMGDKAFGLLVAHSLGLNVPRTLVISRKFTPFVFGQPTGYNDHWFRTCPPEPVPGKYPTKRGYVDPIALYFSCDDAIASLLHQQGVRAVYSGVAASRHGEPDGMLVNAVPGFGDEFMLGEAGSVDLPDDVYVPIASAHRMASAVLGPVRFEWVWDGRNVWFVQLHLGDVTSDGQTIVPGEARSGFFRQIQVEAGLEALRAEIDQALKAGDGIELVGTCGVLSHLGDVLRKAGIPSRIVAG